MALEFKIGRLRFTWAGEWVDTVFYNRDAIIQYEGKCYVCKEPHTSQVNFYDDLYFITPGGASTPRWELMLDGKVWKEDWLPSTFYSLGNIVRYSGIVYVCTEEHTSGLTQIDQTKWTTYFQFDNWNTDWTVGTIYGIGDIIKYGGIVYRCTADHLSAASLALGLEADQGKWEIVNDGLEYRSDWVALRRYKRNDIVKRGSDAYICTAGHTATSTFDATKFDLWLPGAEFENAWSSSTVYQPGDIVIYGGYSYTSLVINNTNNIPSTDSVDSSSAWQLLTKGFNTRADWSSSNAYKVGDIVRRGGQVFVAVSDSNSQDPSAYSVTKTYTATGSSGTTIKVTATSGITVGMILQGTGFTQGQTVVSVQNSTTVIINAVPDATLTDNQTISFVGVNYTFWSLVVPGISWIGFWQTETLYVAGELVIWQNNTYRCINTIPNTTTSIRPDLDVNNSYWTVFAAHDRFNAGNTQGDIVYRNTDNVNIALPIGTSDFILRATDGVPQWRKVNTLPDIYYVTPDGIDAVGRGDSIDKPWKSIRYACDTILLGTLLPNANYLLTANKDFIVAEMYEWMIYQKNNNIAPFTSTSVFDEFSTRRDAKLIIDALSYDITRGSNSRIIFGIESYFATGSDTTFRTPETDASQPFIVAGLTYYLSLIGLVLTNTAPTANYQDLNSVPTMDRVTQVIDLSRSVEMDAFLEIQSLINLLIDTLATADKSDLPLPNQGITATIMIKTGTYSEALPIVVPDNVALNGDELRGAVVQPITRVATFATNVYADSDEIKMHSVSGMVVDMPIQMKAPSVNDQFGNVTEAQTYYIKTIDEETNRITISETIDGDAFDILDNDSGYMDVYAGDCLKDMFYVRNATGIRNMTLTGLAGFLGARNGFGTQRPSGGAYVSLDPGEGPDDTRCWIIRRSPYIQNVTTFGTGCVGNKIDGRLHNGGNKSCVSNDFTQILSDGIGVWCTGPGSLTELVSVFSYYGYCGYFAEDGGRIRATNGNTSYGVYGVIAEGFDDTEVPISGKIDNQSSQVQADVQNAFGTAAEILSMQYNNAGSNYLESTTNMLLNSNNFLTTWQSDSITFQRNTTAPDINGDSIAWTLSGTTSSTDNSYVYQTVAIPEVGAVYIGLSTLNITGSGSSATFDITVGASGYSAIVNGGGGGYVVGNELRILGSQLGGIDGANDCFLAVESLAGSSILSVTVTGTVPTGSALKYTLSVYAKAGSSSSFDMSAIFSGSSTVTANINYTFNTGTFSTSVIGGTGSITTGKLELTNGWYRIWMVVNDYNALNNQLQFRLYPRSRTGNSGNTLFYGAQLQIGDGPTFYLDTTDKQHTAFADFYVTGSGTDVEIVADEIRSGGNFQTRLTDTGTGSGGRGYLVGSNNAQGGTTGTIILSGSDVRTAVEYETMRVFVQSGTGAGQYGYISSYDDGASKIAQVLRESFENLDITATDNATGLLTVSGGNTSTLYLDQPVQFIPAYYTTNVTRTSTEELAVSATLGGTTNVITLASTAKLSANMTVKFIGNMLGGLTGNFSYYIKEIVNGTQISLSTEPFGNVQQLVDDNLEIGENLVMIFPSFKDYINADTSNMIVNMPVSFVGTSIGGIDVGTTYYINDVIDVNAFSIASTLIELTVTATQTVTNYLTTGSTSTLVPLTPVLFSGVVFGGVSAGTKYYIDRAINATQFTITDTIIVTTATATTAVSNLITVLSTTGFTANSPIKFIGNTFGGVVNNTIYYIQVVNDATSFTVSTSPGGSALTLSTASGEMTVRTSDEPFVVTTASGSMTASTTNTKSTISYGQGSMNAVFSTKLFGNVVKGTTYYVKTIPNATTFTVSATPGGLAFTLKTDIGAMKVGAVGWDHINPGTPIESALDNSSVYYVEPKATYSAPPFSQTATTLPTLGLGVTWAGIAHGDGTFLAVPNSFSTAARSTDGSTWTTLTLPINTSWSDVAYGNGYWTILSNEVVLDATPSRALISNSNGTGWRVTSLPLATAWTKLSYGNGRLIAISNTNLFTFKDVPASTVSGTGAGVKFNVTLNGGNATLGVSVSGAGYAIGNQVKILGSAIGGTTPTNDLTITVVSMNVAPGDPTTINTFSFTGSTTALNGTASAYSTNYGKTWTLGGLLPGGTYTGLTYGSGKFVAVAQAPLFSGLTATNITATGSGARFNVTTSGSSYVAVASATGTGYAVGQTLRILGTALGGASPANDLTITISEMASGLGADTTAIAAVTVAGTAVSTRAAYSENGVTWTTLTLPSTANWSDVAYGNGLYVAVSSSGTKAAYTRDLITWNQSLIPIGAVTKLAYGQGVFLGVNAANGVAWTTEDGITWLERAVSNSAYTALKFGFNSTGQGRFITAAGQNVGSSIGAGTRTKGRVTVASGRISSVILIEPGSGYLIAPSLVFTDPNITLTATTLNRISNGTLANPTFINRGQDYNSNSTSVIINGGGYADTFQVGLTLIVKELTSLPAPGDNLVIAGNTTIYKVTNATVVFGTVAPNIKANIQTSPEMSTALSPAHDAVVTIRQKYSQARLTGHDFLSIGYGNFVQTNYPDVPEDTVLAPQDQAVEVNFGRVFYTSTDQDGNFKVGGLFAVEQATGIITLSASQFGLSGLETLSLGGIAVGGSSVVVRQFSTDETFVANSNEIIPTQRAVKAYLSNRLSQGGSNTFTGQLIAGTVLVGGPDRIASTIPNGIAGSVVNMPTPVRIQGQFAGWDGDGMALYYFIKSGNRRGF
jgi:hypothetical protein